MNFNNITIHDNSSPLFFILPENNHSDTKGEVYEI